MTDFTLPRLVATCISFDVYEVRPVEGGRWFARIEGDDAKQVAEAFVAMGEVRDALMAAADIADAIDSGRGNEKIIAKQIRARAECYAPSPFAKDNGNGE